MAEAFETRDKLRATLADRAVTRTYLTHLSEGSHAVARACFHAPENVMPVSPVDADGDSGMDGAAVEGLAWPPEPMVLKIRDQNVDAEGIRERLAMPLGNKVLIITRRSVEVADIRRGVASSMSAELAARRRWRDRWREAGDAD